MHDPQDSAALLESIIRSATDYAIIGLDAERRVTMWSPGAATLLGWTAEEIEGGIADAIFTPEDRAAGAPEHECAAARTSGRAEDERWHIRKDGSRFWGSGVLVPIKGDASPGFVKILRDRTKEHLAERSLRRSEEQFRALVANIPQMVWRARRLGNRIWGSPQWEQFTGLTLPESVGLGWLDAIHPDDRELTMDALNEAEWRGELYVEHRTRRASDGEFRWFQTRANRIDGEDDGETEWIGTSTDVHDMRRALERQNVLVRELHHRTRNLLGVVGAIARQTLRRSEHLDEFAVSFNDRISALARVQGLVSSGDVALHDLVASEVMAHAADQDQRVDISGSAIRLHEKAAETMALALHELATNAVKYGALGKPAGRLRVSWTTRQGWLLLEWTESGVEGLGASARRGYGRELIEVALPFALGARTRLEFPGDGLYCRIELPDHEWKI
ncbi:MAG TPA: PAS domain S-box protein [Hyphomicrobiaceae bacterium]|nr:PAS domain S-box protein [Hyphomicrobiaceae bacterium]